MMKCWEQRIIVLSNNLSHSCRTMECNGRMTCYTHENNVHLKYYSQDLAMRQLVACMFER